MTSTFSANRRNIFHLRYGSDVNGYEVLCNDDGTLFTGLVYEALPSGSLTAEYEVKDGLKDGVDKEYYAEGVLECLSHYRKGELHGDVVYYYPNGTMKEKSVFEYGICTEEFVWDEDGKLVHHSVLAPDNFQFTVLERRRLEDRQ